MRGPPPKIGVKVSTKKCFKSVNALTNGGMECKIRYCYNVLKLVVILRVLCPWEAPFDFFPLHYVLYSMIVDFAKYHTISYQPIPDAVTWFRPLSTLANRIRENVSKPP